MHRLCLRTLDMGAGQINSNKAFDPGLIYDATGQDYVNLLCSLNNCRHPILKCSTTSPCYTFSTPSSHLNYPSFISLYGDATRSINRIFQRTTNADQGPAIYKVQLTKHFDYNFARNMRNNPILSP